MDSITHLAIGACIGEAMIGRKVGKKALWIGALAQTVPDIDFVTSFWMDVDNSLLAHRGFTHSFLFAILSAWLLAFAFQRWSKTGSLSFKSWFIFFIVEIIVHLFIDAFNSYGTGWFEPFNHYRVSFNTIFVADPLFSVWPGIAFLILLVLKRTSARRRRWAWLGITASIMYLAYCLFNKAKVDSEARAFLREHHAACTDYFTTPTPLNNWLWFIVIKRDSGFEAGYYSVFDKKKDVKLYYFPQNDSLLDPVKNQKDVKHLLRFSKGFYTVEQWDRVLVFNDLRFGQINGWYNPGEKFVFHYFIGKGDNHLVVQRGRFSNWNWKVARSLIKRIKGN